MSSFAFVTIEPEKTPKGEIFWHVYLHDPDKLHISAFPSYDVAALMAKAIFLRAKLIEEDIEPGSLVDRMYEELEHILFEKDVEKPRL